MAGMAIRTTTIVKEMRNQVFVARNLQAQFPDDARALGMLWALRNLADAWGLDWDQIEEEK